MSLIIGPGVRIDPVLSYITDRPILNLDAGNAHAFWGAATPYLSSEHNCAWTTITSSVVTPTNQWVFGF